jgi:ferredoxin
VLIKEAFVKKVYVDPGCICCGTCEIICPEVFKVGDTVSIDESADLQKNEECIKESAEICPVGVIKYED